MGLAPELNLWPTTCPYLFPTYSNIFLCRDPQLIRNRLPVLSRTVLSNRRTQPPLAYKRSGCTVLTRRASVSITSSEPSATTRSCADFAVCGL
ncbi:hypothetical protein RRG08_032509 [Elysia crispata]|uniref:Uncharacterized protein n=1 Tax=Elysia crispata TaxID=231223 RepID=A0AAE1DPE4_9GAST|nr:hypothetical protein RRG08_032509 [Elysia crispata]